MTTREAMHRLGRIFDQWCYKRAWKKEARLRRELEAQRRVVSIAAEKCRKDEEQ